MSALKTGNYPRETPAAPLFLNSVVWCFLMEVKSDLNKDDSSAKMFVPSLSLIALFIFL